METSGFLTMFLVPGAAVFFIYLVEYYDNESVTRYIKNQTWLFAGLLGTFIIITSIVVKIETIILILGMGYLFALLGRS